MTKTDPATLPQFRGAPVPWVTRWSSEVQTIKWGVQMRRDGPHLLYQDGMPEYRDEHGVLWQREGLGRHGEPEWSAVNAYRQRKAMLRGLCQICGQKIEDKPIRWLLGIDQVEEIDPERWITQSPPTCNGCVELSLELCPNLKRYGYMIFKVIDYEIWGVFGEALVRAGLAGSRPGPMGLRRIQTGIGYNEDYGALFNLNMVLAKQQIVLWGKHVLEEFVPGKERPNNYEGPTTTLAAMVEELG